MANQTINLTTHPKYAALEQCTLTTKRKVCDCLVEAISVRYNRPVNEKTKIGNGGLGLDDMMIRTDLFATVVIAVHDCGGQLKSTTPDSITQADTIGKIADQVWGDLIS